MEMRRAKAILLSLALITAPTRLVLADSQYSVGIEGFHDHYERGDTSRDNCAYTSNTDYGSATLGYMHSARNFFTAVDLRYSQGNADYHGRFGNTNRVSQTEGEVRVRTGV